MMVNQFLYRILITLKNTPRTLMLVIPVIIKLLNKLNKWCRLNSKTQFIYNRNKVFSLIMIINYKVQLIILWLHPSNNILEAKKWVMATTLFTRCNQVKSCNNKNNKGATLMNNPNSNRNKVILFINKEKFLIFKVILK